MSWNLLIYKHRDSPQSNASLGSLETVTAAFTSAFNGLEWVSTTEAALPLVSGFRLELTEEDGTVRDVYTHGGFHHLSRFAALCKSEGWRMADAQEGEDVDLDYPQGWNAQHS